MNSGNLIGYYVNSTITNAPTLNCWNSTQAIIVGTNGITAWQWRPTQNAIIAFSRGIMWTKPLATNISGNALPSTLSIRNNDGDTIVMNAYAPGSGSFPRRMGNLCRLRRTHRKPTLDTKHYHSTFCMATLTLADQLAATEYSQYPSKALSK